MQRVTSDLQPNGSALQQRRAQLGGGGAGRERGGKQRLQPVVGGGCGIQECGVGVRGGVVWPFDARKQRVLMENNRKIVGNKVIITTTTTPSPHLADGILDAYNQHPHTEEQGKVDCQCVAQQLQQLRHLLAARLRKPV